MGSKNSSSCPDNIVSPPYLLYITNDSHFIFCKTKRTEKFYLLSSHSLLYTYQFAEIICLKHVAYLLKYSRILKNHYMIYTNTIPYSPVFVNRFFRNSLLSVILLLTFLNTVLLFYRQFVHFHYFQSFLYHILYTYI